MFYQFMYWYIASINFFFSPKVWYLLLYYSFTSSTEGSFIDASCLSTLIISSCCSYINKSLNLSIHTPSYCSFLSSTFTSMFSIRHVTLEFAMFFIMLDFVIYPFSLIFSYYFIALLSILFILNHFNLEFAFASSPFWNYSLCHHFFFYFLRFRLFFFGCIGSKSDILHGFRLTSR